MYRGKITTFALFYLALLPQAYGHGGGLNSMGCHRQTSDNTYHCHSGVLDGQSFSTEAAMISAFNSATSPTPTPAPTPTASPTPSAPTAYNRDDYMTSWLDSDKDCLDTRHEALAIESRVVPTMSPDGCTVIAGLWVDAYTGQSFTNPSDLDIDHMVPLAEAHSSGAWQWNSEGKRGYANDLLNSKALIAVSASANRSKGSKDPAQWLPPSTAFHCEYVKDWVEVKRRYGLEIDVAERTAIEGVLGAGIEFAARAESGGWNQRAGQPSTAIFGLGLRKSDQCAYSRQATSTDNIELTISVLPEADDLHNQFDVFLVAELPNGLFSLNSRGQFVPFAGDIASLAPFKTKVTVRQSFEFELFKGVLNEALKLNLYIGYQTSGGDFVFTTTPLNLSITK